MSLTIPFPGQDGAGLQLDLPTVESDELGHNRLTRLFLANTIEELADGRIEIPGDIRLPPITHDRGLQMFWQMG